MAHTHTVVWIVSVCFSQCYFWECYGSSCHHIHRNSFRKKHRFHEIVYFTLKCLKQNLIEDEHNIKRFVRILKVKYTLKWTTYKKKHRKRRLNIWKIQLGISWKTQNDVSDLDEVTWRALMSGWRIDIRFYTITHWRCGGGYLPEASLCWSKWSCFSCCCFFV